MHMGKIHWNRNSIRSDEKFNAFYCSCHNGDANDKRAQNMNNGRQPQKKMDVCGRLYTLIQSKHIFPEWNISNSLNSIHFLTQTFGSWVNKIGFEFECLKFTTSTVNIFIEWNWTERKKYIKSKTCGRHSEWKTPLKLSITTNLKQFNLCLRTNLQKNIRKLVRLNKNMRGKDKVLSRLFVGF